MFVLLTTVTVKAQHNTDSIDAQKRAVEYFLVEATGLQEQERLDESFELIEYCRELDPESSAIQYLSSQYHFALGNDSLAREMLECIVESNPDNETYSKALVQYYYNKCDLQAAISVYEKLVKTAKSKEDIYMGLYALYYENGDYGKALATLEDITRFVGSTLDIMLQRLKLYLHLGRNDEAIALAKQMIDENPDDTRYVYLLGGTYDIIGDHEMAEKIYKQILDKDPDDVTAMSSLVEIYANNDNVDEYETYIERILRNEKFDSEDRLNIFANYVIYLEFTDSTRAKTFIQEMVSLPFCQLEHNQIYLQYLEYKEAPAEEILPVLDKIVELNPEDVSAIIKQLSYAIDRDDAYAVIEYADKALLYLPHILDLYKYKALSYYVLEDKEKSIEMLEQGIAACNDETSSSDISNAYAMIGDFSNLLGMKGKCYAAYDSALIYNPYNTEVLNNYAYLLSIDKKELQKALDMSKRTIDAEPENETYLDTYAWILFNMKRFEEAKAYAEKMISLETELSGVVLHHIGDIYAKCGDIEKALIYWQQAHNAGDESNILKKKIRKRRYYNGKY